MAGQAPTANITIPKPLRPPLYEYSKGLGYQLPDLYTRPMQTYQGIWQPTMSPTLQQTGSFLQGRAISPAPQVLGQAMGSLGGYMSGGMRNPYGQNTNRFTDPGLGVMGPQALTSSRNSMVNFQNPSYANPVKRMGRGYNNYWQYGR